MHVLIRYSNSVCKIPTCTASDSGPGSSVGIATGYGQDSPGNCVVGERHGMCESALNRGIYCLLEVHIQQEKHVPQLEEP
jgi:hypothetical protein